MLKLTLLGAIFAALSFALPQNDCSTITSQVFVPSTTYTYLSTAVVTSHATGVDDLGTFTFYKTISTTTTLETLTATSTACGATGVVTEPVYSTVYTNASQSTLPPAKKRALALYPRDSICSVTVTVTSPFGATETWIPAGVTSTYIDYTAFSQATLTSTVSGGRAWVIATATTTVTAPVCGTSTVHNTQTSTVTQDARCAPAAQTSAWYGFGLEYEDDVPLSGAAYHTTTDDASQCCQLCADAYKCAASSWDIRNGKCTLEFPVDFSCGELDCGQGLLAFYGAGPNHPAPPGSGLYVAALCGNVNFANAPPDDGS